MTPHTLGRLARIDEGIHELWIAKNLHAGWEPPLVAIGELLIKAGRTADGLRHLEQVARDFPNSSYVELAYFLGVARMLNEQSKLALEAYRRVLELKPDHAEAHDLAAHCCFVLGDRQQAARLAKRARHLGVSETFDRWKRGEYSA